MALSTATMNALDCVMRGVGNAEELATVVNRVANLTGNLPDLSGVTATSTEINKLAGVVAGTAPASGAAVLGAAKQIDTVAVASIVNGVSATAGSATQAITTIAKKTGIADNTATSIFRITCPNAEHAAIVEVTLLATVLNTATFESSRVAVGYVVFDRTTGAALVGTASALSNTGIATSGTATLTLAYSLTAASGAVGASNTIDIQVTLVKTGGTVHQIVASATIINSEATGMTIAAV